MNQQPSSNVNRLPNRPTNRPASQYVNQRSNQPPRPNVNRPPNQPTNPPARQYTSQRSNPTPRSNVNRHLNQPTNRPTSQNVSRRSKRLMIGTSHFLGTGQKLARFFDWNLRVGNWLITVDNCLLCIPLKPAGCIIAIGSLAYSIVSFCLVLYVANHHSKYLKVYVNKMDVFTYFVVCFSSSVHFIVTSIFLLIGTLMVKPILVKVYLWGVVIHILVSFINTLGFSVYCIINADCFQGSGWGQSVIGLVCVSFYSAIWLYFMTVINSMQISQQVERLVTNEASTEISNQRVIRPSRPNVNPNLRQPTNRPRSPNVNRPINQSVNRPSSSNVNRSLKQTSNRPRTPNVNQFMNQPPKRPKL